MWEKAGADGTRTALGTRGNPLLAKGCLMSNQVSLGLPRENHASKAVWSWEQSWEQRCQPRALLLLGAGANSSGSSAASFSGYGPYGWGGRV